MQEVLIDYTNWRGERAKRRIYPTRLVFEANQWHPKPQWLIEAYDMEKGVKGEKRLFALASIHSWTGL